MGKFINLTGVIFSRLTVIEIAGRGHRNQILWLCRCECGNQLKVDSQSLNSKHTRSCGCLWRDTIKFSTPPDNSTHNESGPVSSAEYDSWEAMKQRCLNPNHKAFKYYGGRSITICKSWINSYENFLKDMGRKPLISYTLERKNPDLGYNPDNCKWATKREQTRNKRNTRYISEFGKKLTILEWAEITAIPYKNILYHNSKGLSLSEMLYRLRIRHIDGVPIKKACGPVRYEGFKTIKNF